MYISKLKLWNYRKFGSLGELDLEKPDLLVPFNKGMNILIGENDSGKTAILDAIKLVLKTHAYEWIKIEENDFYSEGELTTEKVRIEIEFSGMSNPEASNFIEWCGWEEENGEQRPKLILVYQTELKNGKITPSDVKAGMDGVGHLLNAEAKEYLKCTYLKALRNADRELNAKRNSRLSQILKEHPLFRLKDEKGKEEFESIFKNANKEITDKFKDERQDYYKKIKKVIDTFISAFIGEGNESKLDLGDPEITNILEKISLGILDQKNLGLGTMNRLFMAAELLHLKREGQNGLKLCLIEELEAHLHPQAQLKIINRLKKEDDIQYILTSHSPNITSQAELENIIICRGKNVYPLTKGSTKLDDNDYKYLERFLDVTKSNLFFSRGNIIVEGWSEEILLPVLAKKIGYDLTAKEISIINVASTAYLHFAKIFLRKGNDKIDIPNAIITDLDKREYEREIQIDADGKPIKVGGKNEYEYKKQQIDNYEGERKKREKSILKDESSAIRVFVSNQWTLEWCLLKSSALNSQFKEVLKDVHPGIFNNCEDEEEWEVGLAKILLSKSIKKTEIANKLIDGLNQTDNEMSIPENDTISYLVEAIKHVCEYEN